MVITVTERAKEDLKAILITNGADPEQGFRLLPMPGDKYMLKLDTKLSGDQVVEYEGYKVLLVGIEYYRTLDGKTLDCQDTEHGRVLLVR